MTVSPEQPPTRRWLRPVLTVVVVLMLFAVAGYLRFWRLDQVPGFFHFDEGNNGKDALRPNSILFGFSPSAGTYDGTVTVVSDATSGIDSFQIFGYAEDGTLTIHLSIDGRVTIRNSQLGHGPGQKWGAA